MRAATVHASNPRLREDQAAIDALEELSGTRVDRGVVMADGHLLGILSVADLGRALGAGLRRRA